MLDGGDDAEADAGQPAQVHVGRVDAAQLPAVPGRQQSVLLVGWVRGLWGWQVRKLLY